MVEGNEVSIEFELRWHGHGIRMVSGGCEAVRLCVSCEWWLRKVEE